MTARHAPLASLLLVVAAGTALAEDPAPLLENGSFEAVGDAVPGWEIATGATTQHGDGSSKVEIDRKAATDGKASLRLEGGPGIGTWRLVQQARPAAAGRRAFLEFRVRSDRVEQQRGQFANSNGLLIAQDAAGQRLGFWTSFPSFGTRAWSPSGLHVVLPAGTSRVTAGFFLSCNGRLWIDDVRLRLADARPTTPAARQLAVDALEWHLTSTYPFWGMAGRPQPDALFAKHRAALLGADGEGPFLDALEKLLADLSDVHAWITTPDGVRAPAQKREVVVNRSDMAVLGKVTESLGSGRFWFVGILGKGDERVGYVSLNSLDVPDDVWARFEEAIAKLDGVPVVLLDLRRNGGGAEVRGQRLAGGFVSRPTVYARQRYRDPGAPDPDVFLPAQDRVLRPERERALLAERVIVLQGPFTVSSAEGLLLMAKAIPSWTTVGLPSRGASGNPGAFPLWEGHELFTSRWQSLDLEGTCIEGVGVAPDVRVEHDPGTKTGDPTLDKALELARAK